MEIKLYERIINFLFALLIWAKGGFKFPDTEILHTRISICISTPCEKWNKKAYFGFGGCNKCGCSKLKLYLKTSECPLKKW